GRKLGTEFLLSTANCQPSTDLHFSLEHLHCRAGEPERFARSFPAHDHSTAASVDLNLFLQKSQAPADRDRGACAGAACERLPDTALVHTQTNAVWCHDLHETDIRTIRKARVILYRWPDRVHVRIAYRRDLPHRVGVAHRYRADLKLFLSDPKRIDVRFSGSFERYRLGVEMRRAHRSQERRVAHG